MIEREFQEVAGFRLHRDFCGGFHTPRKSANTTDPSTDEGVWFNPKVGNPQIVVSKWFSNPQKGTLSIQAQEVSPIIDPTAFSGGCKIKTEKRLCRLGVLKTDSRLKP